jgi:deoxyribose-phosphate aldolase
MDLAPFIDHTLLKADAKESDIRRLCDEAREYRFHSVCINGSRIIQARHFLEGSEVRVCTVVGFPLGACDPDSKRYETEVAVDLGADEIDMVINVGMLKDGRDEIVRREIRDVIEAADDRIVKVILETSLLTEEEIKKACEIAVEAEAHFVKTSTGFGGGGATEEHVQLMRKTVGQKAGVKASGGIRDAATADRMIKAGATRLGTSASVTIVQGADAPITGSY